MMISTVTRLRTFNLERALKALALAQLIRDPQSHAAARAACDEAGIMILGIHGARGTLMQRKAALCDRIRAAIGDDRKGY